MDVAIGAMAGQRQQDLSLGAVREEARACSKSSAAMVGTTGTVRPFRQARCCVEKWWGLKTVGRQFRNPGGKESAAAEGHSWRTGDSIP